jgi:hypothetical protein
MPGAIIIFAGQRGFYFPSPGFKVRGNFIQTPFSLKGFFSNG